ncbi:hypothetical protein [Bacillus sp. T3]|uniref:hypothetical protein n=1 Tax=Bacillus sp. T3 TaxID=467262 RepID=UPI002982A1C9|nr:hypothetical protein [Bacillus sp. T3]
MAFVPGTVNLPGIAAMTVAAKKAFDLLDVNDRNYLHLRTLFIESLKPLEHRFHIHGSSLSESTSGYYRHES